MNNADRKANILDALNRLGPSTPSALASWLGNPYFFEANVSALVADGAIFERVEHASMGAIVRFEAAK